MPDPENNSILGEIDDFLAKNNQSVDNPLLSEIDSFMADRNKPKKDQGGWFDTFLKSAEKTTYGLTGGVANAFGNVMDDLTPGPDLQALQLQSFAKDMEEKGPKLTQEEAESWPAMIGSAAVSFVPTVAGVGLTAMGAPQVGVPLAEAGFMGLTLGSAGMAMQEYDNYAKAKGIDPKDQQLERYSVAVANGAIEYLTERIGVAGPMLDYAKKFGKPILKAGTKETVDFGKEIIQNYAKKNPAGYKKAIKAIAGAGTREGGSEALAEFSQAAVNNWYKDVEDRTELKDMFDQAWKAGVIGAGMGMGVGPISFNAQNIQDRQRREKQEVVRLGKLGDESVEIVGFNKDGEEGGSYTVMYPDGRTKEVPTKEIENTVDLSTEQFYNVLKGKADENTAIETSRIEQEKAQRDQINAEIDERFKNFKIVDESGEEYIQEATYKNIPVYVVGKSQKDPEILYIVDQQAGGQPKAVDSGMLMNIETIPVEAYRQAILGDLAKTPDEVGKVPEVGEELNFGPLGQGKIISYDPRSGEASVEFGDPESENYAVEQFTRNQIEEFRPQEPTQSIEEVKAQTDQTNAQYDDEGNVIKQPVNAVNRENVATFELEKEKIPASRTEKGLELNKANLSQKQAQALADEINETYPNAEAYLDDRTPEGVGSKADFRVLIKERKKDESSSGTSKEVPQRGDQRGRLPEGGGENLQGRVETGAGKRPIEGVGSNGKVMGSKLFQEGKQESQKPEKTNPPQEQQGKRDEEKLQSELDNGVSSTKQGDVTNQEDGRNKPNTNSGRQETTSKPRNDGSPESKQGRVSEEVQQDSSEKRPGSSDVVNKNEQPGEQSSKTTSKPQVNETSDNKRSTGAKEDQRSKVDDKGKSTVKKANRKARPNPVLEKLTKAEPSNIRQAIMQDFASGQRVDTESFRKETGFGAVSKKDGKRRNTSEFNKRIWAVKNGAPTVDELVLQYKDFWQTNKNTSLDEQDIRNEIISVLSDFSTKSELMSGLSEDFTVNGEIVLSEDERTRLQAESEYQGRFNTEVFQDLTDDELSFLENNPQVLDEMFSASELTDQEAENLLKDEEEFNNWLSLQYEQDTTSESSPKSPQKEDAGESFSGQKAYKDYLALRKEGDGRGEAIAKVASKYNQKYMKVDDEIFRLERKNAPTFQQVIDQSTDQIPYLKGTDETNAVSKYLRPFVAQNKERIAKVVDKTLGQWKNAPEAKVWESILDFQMAYPNTYIPDPGNVSGVFFDDKIHIIASHPRFSDEAKVLDTILHESVGHYGLRGMFERAGDLDQKQFNALLDEVTASYADDKLYQGIAKRYFGKDVESLTKKEEREVSEEYIAHVAQTGANQTLIDKIVAWLRKLWQDITGSPLKFSDVELRGVIASSRRFLQTGESLVPRMPKLSTAGLAPDLRMQLSDNLSTFTSNENRSGQISRKELEGGINLPFHSGSKEFNHPQYVAFSPTQIKSATGNQGTFDPKNPDIRFQLSESEKKYVNLVYGSAEKLSEAVNKTISEVNEQLSFFDNRGYEDIRQVQPRTVLKDFAEKGYVDFTGQKISNSQDVADLFQVYRSPYIEKSHVIYLDEEGKILKTTAQTLNRQGMTAMPEVVDIQLNIRRLGAKSVYLLHNHPSGNHKPSDQDIRMTKYYGQELGDKLEGHVIIDTDKFTFINRGGAVGTLDYKSKPDPLFSDRFYLPKGKTEAKMAEVADHLLKRDGSKLAVVYLDNRLGISAYDTLPPDISIEDLKERIAKGVGDNLGTMYAVVHDGVISKPLISFPPGMVDLIDIKNTNQNFFTTYKPTKPSIESLWEPQADYNPSDNFYSNSLKSIANIGQNKATPDQWRSMLLKNGASEAELKWIGFDDFLKGKEKLTKDEVYEFIQSNQIEVVDVVKGSLEREWVEENDRIQTPDGEFWITDNGSVYQLHQKGHGLVASAQNIDTLKQRAGNYDPQNPTRYSQHTVPGGSNYKEVLLTMAHKRDSKDFISQDMFGKNYSELSGSDKIAVDVQRRDRPERDRPSYRSSHWDEPGILSHIRFDERMVNGEKTLFIQEIQSDHSQDLRKDINKIKSSISEDYDSILSKLVANGVVKKDCG